MWECAKLCLVQGRGRGGRCGCCVQIGLWIPTGVVRFQGFQASVRVLIFRFAVGFPWAFHPTAPIFDNLVKFCQSKMQHHKLLWLNSLSFSRDINLLWNPFQLSFLFKRMCVAQMEFLKAKSKQSRLLYCQNNCQSGQLKLPTQKSLKNIEPKTKYT